MVWRHVQLANDARPLSSAAWPSEISGREIEGNCHGRKLSKMIHCKWADAREILTSESSGTSGPAEERT